MLLGVGIAILSPDVASGPAFAVELQKFDPTQCQAASGENNQDCVRNWYVEYSAGLIGELKYYSGQEDFLAEMLVDPQESLITARLSLILIEGGTKYSQWAALTDENAAKNAGLDMPRYEAILGVCQEAIAVMRTALFDLRQHRDRSRLEAGQYLKNATACEKVFALAPNRSKLRASTRGERPPAPLAKDGPLQITPK
ncbi:MAG: hypothetical protein JO068_11310 [Hyphomicrobiales bacterium]|nr:hypothetical protein [Hyphomicrobiales bacterium]